MPSPRKRTSGDVEATDNEELQALSWLANCAKRYRALDVHVFIVIGFGHWELRRVGSGHRGVLASSWVDVSDAGERHLHCMFHTD
jgi:hypothetical protein